MSSLLSRLKKFDLKTSFAFRLIVVFSVIVFVDQFFKFISASINIDSSLGFSIERIINYGFIFGIRMSSPFLESLFIIFIFFVAALFYLFLMYFLPSVFLKIKWSVTLICAGAFSNMIDKILHSGVVDFIHFQLGSRSLFINFADIAQSIGWLIVIYQLIRLRTVIWRTIEKRKTIISLKKYQYQFIIYTLWMVVYAILFMILISSEFIEQMNNPSNMQRDEVSSLFPKYIFYMVVAFLIPIITLTFYFSNKIYGPIYAFERYLKSLLKNESTSDFKLREGDQFKNLETIAKELKEKIK